MATFKISKDDSGRHTWMAKGINPKTGKEMIIRGGQAGTPVGRKNPDSERSFDARHDATGNSPKKFINKLRWDNKARLGTSVNIPDELFGKAAAKKSAAKRESAFKKAAAKKASPKKTASKKSAAKRGSAKKAAAKKTSPKKGVARKKAG